MQSETLQVYLFSCNGTSNTGKLTCAGAEQLVQATKMIHGSSNKLFAHPELFPEQAENIIFTFIDGCEKQCLQKLAEKNNVTVKNHLVLTELGIDKCDDPNYTENELQLVIDAIQAKSTPVRDNLMEYLVAQPKCACFS